MAEMTTEELERITEAVRYNGDGRSLDTRRLCTEVVSLRSQVATLTAERDEAREETEKLRLVAADAHTELRSETATLKDSLAESQRLLTAACVHLEDPSRFWGTSDAASFFDEVEKHNTKGGA